jgi:hypothetical protein
MDFCSLTINVSPDKPVTLAAGGFPPPISRGVSEPLEMNVIALRDDSSQPPALIVSLDLLYPGRLVRKIVEAAFPKLPPNRIFLASSHTHRGPMTDDTKARLGHADRDYLDQLTLAFKNIQVGGPSMPWAVGALGLGHARADHSINRRLKKRVIVARRPRFNSYAIAPNPSGFKMEDLSVLVCRDKSSEVRCVVWNYACHPVSAPSKDMVAAHYPHIVRTRIREYFSQPELPVLFLQGFSGNTRPSESVKARRSTRGILRLLGGQGFSDMSVDGYGRWCSSLADVAISAVKDCRPLMNTRLVTRRVSIPADQFVYGAEEPHVTFQSIQLSPEFRIVAASAEVVAEYGPLVQEIVGSGSVMCVGCIDHPFGYAPTSKIYTEGGYEGGDFCRAFDLRGVNPDIEESMLLGFRSVLEDA